MNLGNSAISSDFISINGVNIHYLHSGKGAPLILLHGIPTYSYLWRNIIQPLSEMGHAVIAPDFPGYGLSDKPMDAPYTLSYFIDVFNDFIDALGLEKISLVVHDLGGPIGLLWAIRNPDRVEKIAILNTLARPHFSLSMNLLLWAARVPGLSHWISSPAGIAYTMKWGVYNRNVMTPDIISAYQAPFLDIKARHATIKTLRSVKPEHLTGISSQLVKLNKPIHIVCGENDSLLSLDMHQLQKDLPHASFISIKNCGHFIQEDQPRRLIEVLSVIFSQV
ncbi:MAG: alpha/beta fold hydrolase [Syntrophomonadaceae bacterium]